MKKRILLALLIVMLAAGGAFAADFQLSAGLGGMLGGDFGGGYKINGKLNGVDYEATTDTPNFGTGFYGFFDATYAEAFFSVFSPTGEINQTVTVNGQKTTSKGTGDCTYSMVTFGVLGKFPIVISDLITIFPALGIDYRAISKLTQGNNKAKDEDAKKFSALWILGGAGIDFNLPIENVPLYIRLEALYGIRLQNEYESDSIKKAKDNKNMNIDDASAILGHGLTAKLAVGWKF